MCSWLYIARNRIDKEKVLANKKISRILNVGTDNDVFFQYLCQNGNLKDRKQEEGLEEPGSGHVLYTEKQIS